jgi:hypothetical protein
MVLARDGCCQGSRQRGGVWHAGKPAEQKLRALSLHTSDFHNLTDLARAHLGNPRLALQRPLGKRSRIMRS